MPCGTIQEMLKPRVKKEILTELRTPARICGNLDVVDIVIGFLSSGGGRAEKPLGEYMDKVLQMKGRPFSSKVKAPSFFLWYPLRKGHDIASI